VVEFASPAGLHNLSGVSPSILRRQRAERLLREEFEGLRSRVLASVRGRLCAGGMSLDEDDLEACYAMAWQGLYAAMLEGREIANPAGWLVLVTHRRAIDEHRARVHLGLLRSLDDASVDRTTDDPETRAASATGRDFAAELDDRVRLRQLFEGLRGRLDEREREAASLCYLQGLSRSQAATRMGISEKRMRKLMEGRGGGHPGVAGKVGALVETIRDGGWCEEQGSLMRALAYGILDPGGERHRLALAHRGECPACRAYVVSLRGLAATLPPVLLPGGLGAAVLARAGEGSHAASAAGGATAGGGTGVGLGGALTASGAAGAGGAAGGGWLFGAGPLGAKLAVGCLLALGLGAGCVALGEHPARAHDGHRRPSHASSMAIARASATYGLDDLAAVVGRSPSAAGGGGGASSLAPSARASREFGPEQALSLGAAESLSGGGRRAVSAHSASSRSADADSGSAAGGSGAGEAATSAGDESTAAAGDGDSAAAEREFSPG
jgi:RNA polymerase sigma factor (sigma-70 family)